jgi:hypothetical protein
MKKIAFNFILGLFFIIISLVFILSTFGIETDKFNNVISEKASQTNNINLKLNSIKFKLDYKELRLFLETKNPEIIYKDILLPTQNIKVYIDFIPLLKTNFNIRKINLSLKELEIVQLNKLSALIKPSNFKSLINNKIKKGTIKSEIEIFLTEKRSLKNFIAKGTVKGLEADVFSNLNLTKVNLGFFADKNDILIKNIFGLLGDIKISDGDIKLNLDDGIKLHSNFNSEFDFNENLLKKYTKIFNKFNLISHVRKIKADLNNSIFVELDNTYKIKDYNYNISGKLDNSKIEFKKIAKNDFIREELKEIYLSELQIKTNFNSKGFNLKGDGKYSFNEKDYYKINIENNIIDDKTNLSLNFDYGNSLELALINYKKPKNSIANIILFLSKSKKKIKIKKFSYVENKNSININDLIFRENKFLSLKKIDVKTLSNDFSIQNNKKIIIKGNKFDATNLAKFFGDQENENNFERVNSNIEIDFKNIQVPMSEKLENFKLIGEIKKGQFTKISSKGDFGGNNFLDISMKKNKDTSKKYLEIYSDLTRPLLTEYSFFNGLSGGKLLYTSIIDERSSNAKLKIEKFKVVNAPGMIKLLSLADLGGLADLAQGEGLSFDVLEIDMEKNKNFLKIREILATGPSISVLMEGYLDENGITSLRGTLVPAKTLNKMISKIPVIGNIVVPKEVGEGLFGISFKMKGPRGNIKTTINPIRTLTPRFIQKIIDRKKSN